MNDEAVFKPLLCITIHSKSNIKSKETNNMEYVVIQGINEGCYYGKDFKDSSTKYDCTHLKSAKPVNLLSKEKVEGSKRKEERKKYDRS